MSDHSSDEARLFHEGIRLFNEDDWFEAHEVWEDIWHDASGPKKHFYQGLIQCAVTIEHVRRGNPRGVRNVWANAQKKFVGLGDVYMGVPVRRLLDTTRRFILPVLELDAEWFNPAQPRGRKLPVDWEQVPRITLEIDPFS
jgi:hypothetical protein